MVRGLASSASAAALLLFASSVAFAAKSPQDFIKDAIQGDNSEIMLGQMAQQKAGSQKVRDFGNMLVTDHTQAKQQASAVASRLGVTPADQPTQEASDEQTKLSKLSGDSFDHEFATYMVKDHQKDIQEFQDQAKANDATGALASKQLPVLQKHLQMAQSVAGTPFQNSAASTMSNFTPTQQSSDQWRASKLAGIDIYGPDNKKVGAITDILMTKDGKAELVVVGVGGFLGLGQKDVAIPFEKVTFTDEPMPQTGTANTGGGTGVGAAGNGTAPVTTNGNTTSAAAAGNRSSAYPDHGMINMTADQLKKAPSFTFAK